MQMTNERVERFKGEAAELNLKAGSAARDTQLQVLGLLLMVVGVVGAFLYALASHSTASSLDVQTDMIYAIAMLALTVLGLAIFLRYSLGKFLRLWLLRQMYEGQSHIDQVVDAMKQG
jgi:hypothetical protein